MGGIFSSKSPPAPAPAAPPAAPVEEATFKPGGEDEASREKLQKMAKGKKRLQIPLSGGTTAKAGVQTGK